MKQVSHTEYTRFLRNLKNLTHTGDISQVTWRKNGLAVAEKTAKDKYFIRDEYKLTENQIMLIEELKDFLASQHRLNPNSTAIIKDIIKRGTYNDSERKVLNRWRKQYIKDKYGTSK